jgi:drug/metabolite transporter (DMT)-like permease
VFFGLSGLFGMTGGQVLYLIGVAWCGPATTAIYQPLVPVFTALLAVLTGYESVRPCNILTTAKLAGIALGSGGAIVMVVGSRRSSSTAGSGTAGGKQVMGNLIIIGGCLSMAIYVLLQKKYVYAAPEDDERRRRWLQKPISLTAWSYCAGALSMLAISVPHACASPEILRGIPPDILIPLAYAVFVTSALGYALITYANSVLPASVTTAFWPLQVLVATSLASYLYGEVVSMADAAGGGCVIISMLVVNRSNHLQETAAKAAQAEGEGEGGAEAGYSEMDDSASIPKMDGAAVGTCTTGTMPSQPERHRRGAGRI